MKQKVIYVMAKKKSNNDLYQFFLENGAIHLHYNFKTKTK